MKANEVVFILDRSGSMERLEKDTIGGFNRILKEQKENKDDGEVLVSTVLFDDERIVLHDRKNINDIERMTEKDYIPRGSTALIDAIGYSIKHIANIHKYIRKEDVPEHTLFVIITDGMENASHVFSSDEVKKMIKHEEEKYGWEFLFIGANIDAVETAKTYGIREDYAFNHISDSRGLGLVYGSISKKVSSTRKMKKGVKTSNECLSEVEIDFKNRK